MATLSFWIVLGLAAQVRDLWGTYRHSGDLTPEDAGAGNSPSPGGSPFVA